MQRAVAHQEVGRQQARILEFGNRFPGHPGFYEMEYSLKQFFRDADLEVYEQELVTLNPRTRYRELYLAEPAGSES